MVCQFEPIHWQNMSRTLGMFHVGYCKAKKENTEIGQNNRKPQWLDPLDWLRVSTWLNHLLQQSELQLALEKVSMSLPQLPIGILELFLKGRTVPAPSCWVDFNHGSSLIFKSSNQRFSFGLKSGLWQGLSNIPRCSTLNHWKPAVHCEPLNNSGFTPDYPCLIFCLQHHPWFSCLGPVFMSSWGDRCCLYVWYSIFLCGSSVLASFV